MSSTRATWRGRFSGRANESARREPRPLKRARQRGSIRRISSVAIASLLLIAAVAHSPAQDRPASTTASSAPAADVRFQTVDVTIDTKGQPLAAYQLEFLADVNRVKLVGVEGGDHAAFRDPPYYDPAALSQHRVILAAFITSADLPRTPTRVARLHVQVTGTGEPHWSAKLIVASSDKADSIPAEGSVSAEGVKP